MLKLAAETTYSIIHVNNNWLTSGFAVVSNSSPHGITATRPSVAPKAVGWVVTPPPKPFSSIWPSLRRPIAKSLHRKLASSQSSSPYTEKHRNYRHDALPFLSISCSMVGGDHLLLRDSNTAPHVFSPPSIEAVQLQFLPVSSSLSSQ